MAKDAPLVILDIVRPEIIQTLLAGPATEEVDNAPRSVDAHGVSTARARDVPVCISSMEPLPYSMGLAGLKVLGKEPCV